MKFVIELPDGVHGDLTTEEAIKPYLDQVVEIIREKTFMPGYRAGKTAEECLGIAVSKYFEWTGSSILECAASALEDANYPAHAQVLHTLAESEEK